ncbi:hypothetical protein CK203_043474 [Vitis vinifera]|uniref:Uncharacterized protein n=1 Tax=Vitis vinifera TaxID=29760 RepID=A0A438HR83_VITVI|nr:hypothetical protein CK203_043474 [Vitis vinifera]
MSHVSSYNIAVGLCSPLLCSALSDSPMGAGAVTTLHSRPLFAEFLLAVFHFLRPTALSLPSVFPFLP